MPLAFLFHYLMLNMFRIHPQELATYLLSYFMGCITLVRCVLVLSCGLAGVVWCGIRMQTEAVLQPALFNVQHISDVNTSILRSLRLIC